MDALEWDEEEVITRDRRMPGASFERAARQARRVRIVGNGERAEDTIETNVLEDRRYTRRSVAADVPDDELPTLRGNPIENIDWIIDPKKVDILDVESVIDAELIFDAELILEAEPSSTRITPKLIHSELVEPELIEVVTDPVVEESGEIVAGSGRALVHVPMRERASGRIDFDAFLEESWSHLAAEPAKPPPPPAPPTAGPVRDRTSTPPESWFGDAMDMLDEREHVPDYNTLMPSELGARPKPNSCRRRSHSWFGMAAAAGLVALGGVGVWQFQQGSANTASESIAASPAEVQQPASATPTTRQGLALTSSQTGVDVEVDGVKRGTLPLLIDDLTPGEHHLRFSGSKLHRDLKRTVQISAGEIHDLGRIDLELAKVSLRIELTPPSASVVVRKLGSSERQKLKGPWPRSVELEPGDYEVTAYRYGYLPASQNARFKGSAEATVELELKPAPTDPDDIYDSL